MPYIAKVPVKNHIYLYECTGYRENGKVKSKRTLIGKIDPKTNQPIYKPQYTKHTNPTKTPPTTNNNTPNYTTNDIKKSTIKEIGLTELIDKISNKSGLREALKNSNPKYHNEIYTLAKHLATNNEPFMHCQEWLETVEITENIENLTSQNISKILANITTDEIEKFYQEWAKKRYETEYLALDITSTSSYSELIDNVEWGYNRDGEDLAQINLCMLMGETSRLPVYQTVYQGSLRDVSTLKTTFEKFDAIVGGREILAVMDKGFFSQKNVDELIVGGKKFVVAVPFSSSFAREQVECFWGLIDDFSNNIIVGSDTLRAVVKECVWGEGHVVYVYVFYNPVKAVVDRERLYRKVGDMFERAVREPQKFFGDEEVCRYVDIRLVGGVYSVEVKKDVVAGAKRYSGWLVLVGNVVESVVEVIRIYRAKDVVEKGFMRLKGSLDLARLRVHSDLAVQSKVFVCFVALVLLSHIHNVMVDKGLYRFYTLRLLMRVLSKRRVQFIGEDRIEYPMTKEQREIYSAFGF